MSPSQHSNPDIAALEAQWWKDWWAADYSWDGLKAKTADLLDRDTSLQEYWRAEEPHLITEPGTTRRWTRFHCPLVFADGTPSPKAALSHALAAEIDARLVADQIIILNGAVLPDLHMPADNDARFTRTILGIRARHAYFGDAVILNPAGSRNRQSDSARFDLCFASAWLGGEFRCRDHSVIAFDFSQAVLAGKIDVRDADLHGAHKMCSFAGARFLSEADFRDVDFADGADFTAARFAADANFSQAAFHPHADFTKARFAGPADFFGVQFIGRALFDEVQCLDDISFYKAAFIRRLSINNATFYGRVNLEGITDSDPIARTPQSIELKTVDHDGVKTLSGSLDAGDAPAHASFQSIPKLLARRAVFFEDANFSNRDLLSPSTFERSRFYHRARFHGSDIHANVNLHAARFRDGLHYRPGTLPKYPDDLLKLRFLSEAATTTFAAWKKAYLKTRIDRRKADYTPDGYFDGLEASFRTLKQMMEDRRDRVREGDFFNLELRARRKRSDVPWWERIASMIYWLISDYGNSIVRPLAMLSVLFVASAFAYYVLGETGPLNAWQDPNNLLSAFNFSLRNVFAPFSLFGADNFNENDVWSQSVVLSADPAFSLLIRGIASAQSLLSLLLVFLAGLAGRRRFQIN